MHNQIVSSWSADQDWLYAIDGSSLGKPIAWTASTDTWQEWVDTSNGPAVITGGYTPGTVGLTFSNGATLPLHGGQVDTSSDHKYGAVVTRTRMKRLVHPVGDVNDPSEHQPSAATDPITLWDFHVSGGPHWLSTIHLPSFGLPSAARKGELQNISFSPDDKYVAVLVQVEFGTGPKLVGKTFIFATGSGKLVGSAPYGNGMLWSSDSKSLWLGTPMPEGQGTDRIVNVQGQTVWTWPDSMTRNMVLPISSDTLLVVDHRRLGVWNKHTGLKSFSRLGELQGGAVGQMAPGGTGAMVDLWGSVVYVKWGSGGSTDSGRNRSQQICYYYVNRAHHASRRCEPG